MKKEFLVNRSGKEFALYAGLIDQAHQEGLKRITSKLIQAPTQENGMLAICWAEVETAKGVFSSIGDASPENVGRMIVPHITRMADTRAKARALRDAINVGVTALEELGDLDEDAAPQRGRRGIDPARRGALRRAQPERGQEPPPHPADIRAATNAAITNGDPVTPEQVARLKKLADLLGEAVIIEPDLTAGVAADRIAEMVQAVNAGQGRTPGSSPVSSPEPAALPATQQQITRLGQFQKALGQQPNHPAGLTSDEAAAAIADLVKRFNAQARRITSGSDPASGAMAQPTSAPANVRTLRPPASRPTPTAAALAAGLLVEISTLVYNLGRTDLDMPDDDLPFPELLKVIDARLALGIDLVDSGSSAKRGKPKADGPVAQMLGAFAADGVPLSTPPLLSEQSARWLLAALRGVYDAHAAEQLSAGAQS